MTIWIPVLSAVAIGAIGFLAVAFRRSRKECGWLRTRYGEQSKWVSYLYRTPPAGRALPSPPIGWRIPLAFGLLAAIVSFACIYTAGAVFGAPLLRRQIVADDVPDRRYSPPHWRRTVTPPPATKQTPPRPEPKRKPAPPPAEPGAAAEPEPEPELEPEPQPEPEPEPDGERVPDTPDEPAPPPLDKIPLVDVNTDLADVKIAG